VETAHLSVAKMASKLLEVKERKKEGKVLLPHWSMLCKDAYFLETATKVHEIVSFVYIILVVSAEPSLLPL
jgi:hypothetical protein